MIGTTEQMTQKLHEAMRALITFNGAGIAGVIGLMQRSGPIPLMVRGAGLIFLLGVFAGVAAWVLGGPYGQQEREVEAGFRRMTIAIYVSGLCFLLGTTLAFFGAS